MQSHVEAEHESAPNLSNDKIPGTPPALPLGTALVVTIVGLAIIIGFIAIGALLHVVPLYAGFLFLWYWTSVTHSSPAALAPAMIGSLVGAGLSYMLQAGTATGNAPLALGALGLMIVALFLVIAGRLPTFCNAATMLYVTVFNAPILQGGEDFRQVILATVLGIVWFGATIMGAVWLAARVARSRTAENPIAETVPVPA